MGEGGDGCLNKVRVPFSLQIPESPINPFYGLESDYFYIQINFIYGIKSDYMYYFLI